MNKKDGKKHPHPVARHIEWMDEETQRLRHELYMVDKERRDAKALVKKLQEEIEQLRKELEQAKKQSWIRRLFRRKQ